MNITVEHFVKELAAAALEAATGRLSDVDHSRIANRLYRDAARRGLREKVIAEQFRRMRQ